MLLPTNVGNEHDIVFKALARGIVLHMAWNILIPLTILFSSYQPFFLLTHLLHKPIALTALYSTTMVTFAGVNVSVVRHQNSQPYAEYEAQNILPKLPRKPQEVFIEVDSGERFGVVVKLLPEFKFGSSPDVRITYALGGDGNRSAFHDVSARSAKQVFAKGKPIVSRRSHKTCRINDKWMKCGYTFAPLQIGMLTSSHCSRMS